MTTTPQHPSGARRKGADTRAEIRDVAISLFTERGYDATAMREIAERLGITKAALYYHFDSKEAIILSFFEDHLSALDELLAWGTDQPRSGRRSIEFLDRWIALNAGQGLEAMSFVAANQAAIRSVFPKHKNGLLERVDQACGIILGPDAPLQNRIRTRMALLSAHNTVMAARGTEATSEDILEAAHFAARRLIEGLVDGDEASVGE